LEYFRPVESNSKVGGGGKIFYSFVIKLSKEAKKIFKKMMREG
jgi:hypothetical protein